MSIEKSNYYLEKIQIIMQMLIMDENIFIEENILEAIVDKNLFSCKSIYDRLKLNCEMSNGNLISKLN